jgi:hypothetical protein
MGRNRAGDRRIIKNYTGEAIAMDIRFKILKLLMEDKERSIASDAGMQKQPHRDICKGKQG